MGIAPSRPRCTITTCSGGCLARVSASSSSALYGSTLPPRMPASALISSLGRASSMRIASDVDAKPPNTTEWIAPSRTVASIANTASGIIGM